MALDRSGWLPGLLGWLDLLVNGEETSIIARTAVNLTGDGIDIDVSDDPATEQNTIALSATVGTTSVRGTMSAADKTKLDGIQKQGASQAIAALAIDWSLGGVYTKTLSSGGNTFTFSNAASGMTIIVRLTSHASGSTVTWPTVKWAGGVAPTMSTPSKTDVYTFVHDGTSIYGSVVQNMS